MLDSIRPAIAIDLISWIINESNHQKAWMLTNCHYWGAMGEHSSWLFCHQSNRLEAILSLPGGIITSIVSYHIECKKNLESNTIDTSNCFQGCGWWYAREKIMWNFTFQQTTSPSAGRTTPVRGSQSQLSTSGTTTSGNITVGATTMINSHSQGQMGEQEGHKYEQTSIGPREQLKQD